MYINLQIYNSFNRSLITHIKLTSFDELNNFQHFLSKTHHEYLNRTTVHKNK